MASRLPTHIDWASMEIQGQQEGNALKVQLAHLGLYVAESEIREGRTNRYYIDIVEKLARIALENTDAED